MSIALIFTSLIVTLVVTTYLYIRNSYSYWKRKGIPYKQPSFPFGNFQQTFLQKKSLNEMVEELYNESSEPFVGVYALMQPVLLVRDPKLIKDIFVKDFHSFAHRGFNANVDVDPMADNILLQRGEKWKNARTQTSPAFTSGKLKAMFNTIVDCGKSLEKYIGSFENTDKSVEMREVFARYTTNVIVSVAFGIDIDCIQSPDCEFRKHGQKFFAANFKNTLRANFSIMAPKLAKWLKIRWADKDTGEFMINACQQNMYHRETNNISRKDFFQLLMQLRNTGKIQDNDDWSAKSNTENKSLTVEEMAAQAFLFFGGGFESSSSTMSFCMYELSKHPDIQQKVYDEIVDVLQKHDGKFTYEAVADMKYMGKCLDESLRLHPPFPIASRMSSNSYKIPDTEVTLDEGTLILFSASGLQYDSKYYDEPKKFKPERCDQPNEGFNESGITNLVFGAGPRNCLGMRLGLLQSKTAIILLLQKFKFELADQHKNSELKINPLSAVLAPIGGINLKVTRR